MPRTVAETTPASTSVANILVVTPDEVFRRDLSALLTVDPPEPPKYERVHWPHANLTVFRRQGISVLIAADFRTAQHCLLQTHAGRIGTVFVDDNLNGAPGNFRRDGLGLFNLIGDPNLCPHPPRSLFSIASAEQYSKMICASKRSGRPLRSSPAWIDSRGSSRSLLVGHIGPEAPIAHRIIAFIVATEAPLTPSPELIERARQANKSAPAP